MRAQVGQNRSQERKLPPAPLGQAGPLLTKPALPLWGWRPPTTGRCCEVRSTHWAVWAPGSARVKPQLPPKANTCLHYPGLGLSMISSAGLLWGPTTAGSGRGRSGSTFWNFLQRAHVIMINSYKSALRSARGRMARAGPRGPRLSGTSRSPASCAARRPRDRPPPPSLLRAHAQLCSPGAKFCGQRPLPFRSALGPAPASGSGRRETWSRVLWSCPGVLDLGGEAQLAIPLSFSQSPKPPSAEMGPPICKGLPLGKTESSRILKPQAGNGKLTKPMAVIYVKPSAGSCAAAPLRADRAADSGPRPCPRPRAHWLGLRLPEAGQDPTGDQLCPSSTSH